MEVNVIDTGFFKLDGGAMFGVVPKSLWSRIQPADENNLCTWAMRCLLVQTTGRNILIDTGIGDKQSEKFRSHFQPHGSDTLLNSLQQSGLSAEDITDVFLTHLHFDHVGGAVKRNAEGDLVPTFPNATYWSNEKHYNWAIRPNPREKASFLKENIIPLKEAGVLQFLPVQKEDLEWLPGFKVRFVYGHTEAMMVPIIDFRGKRLFYCADVIPSSFHVSLPYIMSYDLRPLMTLEEKTRILEEAVTNQGYLFFEHDPKTAAATIKKNDRNRFVLGETVAW